jgi:glycosyltransferase involved in cell wall biosynthesis
MENTKSLKGKLTIIIPSKNEGIILYNCIQYLSRQNHIDGVRVIIADISDDNDSILWIKRIQNDFKHIFKIIVIKGGYPSQGRLAGSLLAVTQYMLFLDADILLTKPNILEECIKQKKGLTTVPFYTDKPYRWVFRLFDEFQTLSTLLGTPFAVGGFQLWNTDTYWSVGGYNPEELFAEDYSISQKVNPKDFKVHKINGTYTSSRRFKNKGVLWMFQIMIKSFLNRKNPEFFKKSHGYWD